MVSSSPGLSFHVSFQVRVMENWHFLLPANLLDPGIESVSPWSPALADKFFTTSSILEALYDMHAEVFRVILPINIFPKYICIFKQMPHIQTHGISHLYVYIFVVLSFSPVRLSVTTWAVACQASLSFTISWTLLKCMTIESVTKPNISYFLIPSPLAYNLSQHQGLFK